MNENALLMREIKTMIRDELKFLKEAYAVNDLVNRDEALKILGITSKSFTNYLAAGVINVATTNAAGARFYSRAELTGFKKVLNKKK